MVRLDEGDLDWDDENRPHHEGRPFTGESAEYDRQGRLVALTTYVDGLDEGPFLGWEEGVLIVEGQAHRGVPVGTQREWYENGTPKFEREYSPTGLLLSLKSWDEDGNLTKDRTYETPR